MSAEVSQSVPLDPALLARFREQGAALVAHQRGLTPTCRVKLAEIARSLGIAESQTEEAIRSLTAAPNAPPNPRAERLRRRLRKELTGKKRPIINPALEAKILAAATRKYKISESAASDVLAEVAAELGLTRITSSDALHNIVAQIEQAVGDSTWLAREAWDRLRAAGVKWGLDAAMVDGLIDEQLAANRRDDSRRNLVTRATLYATAGAVLVACLVITGLMLSGNRRSAVTPGSSAHTAAAPKPDLSSAAVAPAWWDVELAVEMAQAKTRIASLAGALQPMASAKADDRAAGYDRLFEQVRAAPEDTALLAAAARIASGAYALDPAEAAAEHVRAALVRLLPASDRPLPASAAELTLSFWAADTAWAALHRTSASAGRMAALAEALGAALGCRLDPAAPRAEHQRLLRERTTVAAYQQFTAHAARQPKEVAALYPALAERAMVDLPKEEYLREETTLLIAALPAAGEQWVAYERPLARCIVSPDPVPALRLIDALRRVTQPALIERLSEMLIVRSAARPSSRDKKDVILAVRKALGGASGLTAADRWQALADESAAALAAPQASDEPALLKQLVELTHFATLAIALSQGEAGFATVDAGLAQPPQLGKPAADPILSLRSVGAKPAPHRPTKAQQRDLARYLGTLDKRGLGSQAERELALRGLTTLAREATELTPEQAASLAAYLLSDKSDAEQGKALGAIASLRNWQQLRLAVADALPASKWSVHQQRELVARLLGRDLGDEFSTPALRRAVLAKVMTDLSSELMGVGTLDEQLAEAGEALAASYRQRAALWGVAPAALAPARTPGQALELALTAIVGQRGRGKFDDLTERLPAELRAARYLAAGDLQFTVAVQRLLVEASGQQVAAQRPQHATTAREIVRQSSAASAASKTALGQLYLQESALLKLWMLYAPEA